MFRGVIIYAGHYTKEKAEEAIANAWADMIGFGRAFIANPDLPYRFENNLELNEGNKDTYFGGGEEGFTDYPACKKMQ